MDAILTSERPVIYAGGGTISSNASDELRELNELLDFPVTNTLMGLGVYPGTQKDFWACWVCMELIKQIWQCIMLI